MWLVSPAKLSNSKIHLRWLLSIYSTLKTTNISQLTKIFPPHALCKPANTAKTNSLLVSKPEYRLTNSSLFNSFKVFVSLGSSTPRSLLKVHPSNKQLFLKVTVSGGNFTSLRLLFNVYDNLHSLLFNVLYSDIKLLSFGSSAFRQEIAALNWGYLSSYTSVFRLNNLSIFFRPNKLNDKFPKAFKFLRINGFHTSIVYDPNYHKRTIYYLQRLSFFSIGIVPANLPKYTLNVSLPTLNDTLLSHLFMLRLFMSISKSSKFKVFKTSQVLWKQL